MASRPLAKKRIQVYGSINEPGHSFLSYRTMTGDMDLDSPTSRFVVIGVIFVLAAISFLAG